ncbi:hypothetical protein DM860_013579 [Cuscuta australis]|uniref:Uncharacterized protein n=1 Tax=Cuscuta australis TaxID=267555 RepID=A0A328EE91_9ASTE|nr:hypothetical protein DM860_013579 [Cuscuta australis]
MFIAPNFARVTAFRYLLKSQCVQLVWSVIVAGIDFKTAVFGGPQRPPSPFRLTVTCLLDWLDMDAVHKLVFTGNSVRGGSGGVLATGNPNVGGS